MSHRQFVALLLLVLVLACGDAGPNAPPIDNPMIERWCDAHPCGWKVDGDFERVGTWHPNDYAVELGEDAEISQLRAELTSTISKCFEFSLMAEVSSNARAYVELDFLDDGSIEFSERIPKSDWDVRKFSIATPGWYDGVRFSMRKEGGRGRVVLAEFYVELKHFGCSATPLELLDRPASAPCERDEECSSGRCNGAVCD